MATLINVLSGITGTGLLIAIVYYCAKKTAEIAISKVLEDYKSELSFDSKRREKSSLVAELLSEWVKKPMDKDKVNKLLWEASMWLPDDEAKSLNDLLAKQGDITTKQLIIKVRSVIQGDKTQLTPNDLTHF